MAELKCIVVTPEGTVRETTADFVALTLFDGEIGISPGHTPMIGRLGAGELRIKLADQVDRYYIEGGFVEVVGDEVSILTTQAMPVEDIDADITLEQLVAARQKPANTPELMAIRDRAVLLARAQLRVADKL